MGKIPLKMSSAKCPGTIGWQYISGPVKARPRLGFIQGGNKSEQWFRKILPKHHSDVIMSAKASQITSVSIVCSTVCSGADKKKTHESSASLAFGGKFTGDRSIPRTKGH